jgi:hypothetical protein
VALPESEGSSAVDPPPGEPLVDADPEAEPAVVAWPADEAAESIPSESVCAPGSPLSAGHAANPSVKAAQNR